MQTTERFEKVNIDRLVPYARNARTQVGSLSMQRAANVPSAIASIIMGAVVLMILARKTIFKRLLQEEV